MKHETFIKGVQKRAKKAQEDDGVYTFDQLDDKAKENALEWFRGDDVLWENNAEDIINWAKEEAPAGFEIDKVYYSGFWSQGDGASWVGNVDLPKWVDVNYNPEEKTLMAKLFEVGAIETGATIKQSGRYYHEETMDIEFYTHADYLNESYIDDEDMLEKLGELGILNMSWKELDSISDELAKDVLDSAKDYARKIYRMLEEEYDSTYTEEYLRDMAEANDWYFEKDGSFAPGASRGDLVTDPDQLKLPGIESRNKR